jgi:hypothetical protein
MRKITMKKRMMWLVEMTLFAALSGAIPALGAPGEKITDFDAPGAGTNSGQGTFGNGINAFGEIAGWYVDGSFTGHGFLRAPDGRFSTFDIPGDVNVVLYPIGLNEGGTVTGWFCDSNVVCHGFVRAPKGAITTVDVVGAGSISGAGQGTFEVAINENDETAGYYVDASNVSHGFLRAANGRITVVEVPGAGSGAGQGTFVVAINQEGTSAGYYLDANSAYHGFLRACDGRLTKFDAPGAGTGPYQGTNTTYGGGSGGLNSAGEVSGTTIDANSAMHGFLRARDGTFITFDAPGAGTGAGQGTVPQGINASGAIGGNYLDDNNLSHGFLRDPDGHIVTFEAPNAGTGAGQGTAASAISEEGATSGIVTDSNSVSHGFLRK